MLRWEAMMSGSNITYFKAGEAGKLLQAVEQALAADKDWQIRSHDDLDETRCVAADYIGAGFTGTDLGFALSLFPEEPDRLQLTMHAEEWPGGWHSKRFGAEHRRAEGLAMPVMRAAFKILGRRFRRLTSRPKRNPLRGKIQEAFLRFAHLANKQILHPLDHLRFYRFIRATHSGTSVLTPGDVLSHLMEAGFGEEIARRLAGEYETGQKVLAVHLYPWELRAERRREKERWKERIKKEMHQTSTPPRD
jgi:hypothetical protein